jgi:hypothetical protein
MKAGPGDSLHFARQIIEPLTPSKSDYNRRKAPPVVHLSCSNPELPVRN